MKCSINGAELTTLDNTGAFVLMQQSSRENRLTISLKTGASFVDFGQVNMKVASGPGWEQLHLITEALRKLVAFEHAPAIQTTIDAIDAQFVSLQVLEALVASRALRIEFTPEAERAGMVGALLAYTSVAFDEIEVGAVASRPLVTDEMIGSRRRMDFGPATILHASVDDGRVGDMPALYMDELDRMSEATDVLAIGNLQRCISKGEDRELIVDEPRRTPLRILSAASR